MSGVRKAHMIKTTQLRTTAEGGRDKGGGGGEKRGGRRILVCSQFDEK